MHAIEELARFCSQALGLDQDRIGEALCVGGVGIGGYAGYPSHRIGAGSDRAGEGGRRAKVLS
jgi:hypothetical protein